MANLDVLDKAISMTTGRSSTSRTKERREGDTRIIEASSCSNVQRSGEVRPIPKGVGDGPRSERVAVDSLRHERRGGDALKGIASGVTFKDEDGPDRWFVQSKESVPNERKSAPKHAHERTSAPKARPHERTSA